VIVEIITAFLGGGGLVGVGAVALRWREQSRTIARDDASAIVTHEELERKALADIIGRYKSELDEQSKRYKEELDEQAQRHKQAIDESAEKLRAAIERGEAAELESERERSRRRAAERERDEAKRREAVERERADKAERELEKALASINQHAGLLRIAYDQIKRDHPSGEQPAIKPPSE
jgi:hypothetical protein